MSSAARASCFWRRASTSAITRCTPSGRGAMRRAGPQTQSPNHRSRNASRQQRRERGWRARLGPGGRPPPLLIWNRCLCGTGGDGPCRRRSGGFTSRTTPHGRTRARRMLDRESAHGGWPAVTGWLLPSEGCRLHSGSGVQLSQSCVRSPDRPNLKGHDCRFALSRMAHVAIRTTRSRSDQPARRGTASLRDGPVRR